MEQKILSHLNPTLACNNSTTIRETEMGGADQTVPFQHKMS
jgi:hypothetical protein